jgi:hypothetical protein
MSGRSRQRSRQSARDFLGRPLSAGDVIVYTALSRTPLRSGVVVKFDGRGGLFVRILRKGRHHQPVAPGTVHIESLSRVVAVPHALKPAVAQRLRQHVSRRPRPAELRRQVPHGANVAASFDGWPGEMRTTPPGISFIDIGISDARQAEYQRKMSMLLARRGTPEAKV